MSVTELFCHFCNFCQLLCRQITADHAKPEGEEVILLFLPHEAAFF